MANAVSQHLSRGLVMMALMLSPSVGSAQVPAVTVRSISVASPPPLRFSYDSQLIIPTRGAMPLPGALQARIIRGTRAEIARAPAEADGCVTFVASRVHPVRRAAGGGLFVAQLTMDWLEPKDLKDGRYVVVVEQDTTNSPVLRVRKTDVPNYLAGAVEIIVERGELRVRRTTRLVPVSPRGPRGPDDGRHGDLGNCVTVQARPDVVALLLPAPCAPGRSALANSHVAAQRAAPLSPEPLDSSSSSVGLAPEATGGVPGDALPRR